MRCALEEGHHRDDEQREGQEWPVEQLRQEVVLALDEPMLARENEEDGVDRDEQDREIRQELTLPRLKPGGSSLP
jgi:hypothetical protein